MLRTAFFIWLIICKRMAKMNLAGLWNVDDGAVGIVRWLGIVICDCRDSYNGDSCGNDCSSTLYLW